jgi:putative FmdB family regulatory protein
MPIYEYDCADCRRRVSLLVRRIGDAEAPACPRCGGLHLRRLMSRFATIRSEEDRMDALADPGQLGDLDEEDPRSVARFMKKMGGELGDEAGEDFEDMVDEAVEGELGAEDTGADADGGSGDDL